MKLIDCEQIILVVRIINFAELNLKKDVSTPENEWSMIYY